MANGQQKAEEYVRNFQIWASTQTDADFTRIIYRGQLNRGEVAKAVGCGKSALTQNPQLKSDLYKLEETLREKGILPPLIQTAKANQKKPKEYDQTVNRNIQDNQQKTRLEVENIELKAKIELLEKKLERFREHSETLHEMGILPR